MSNVRFLQTILPHMFGDAWNSQSIDLDSCTQRQIDMLLSDISEAASGLTDDQLGDLDRILEAEDLPTLTQMMNRTYRKILKILDRGQIKSNDEWRLLNGFVSDVDSTILPNHERTAAEQLLASYENQL